MQTHIHPDLACREDVKVADAILRSCVHCGFCTATCPTYQLLGDELDGPRGRIYLIKNLLEDNAISNTSAAHLDRCLTCRSCETTCPSGVQYGELLDISKGLMAELSVRPDLLRRLVAWVLRQVIPRSWLFVPLLRLGQLFKPVMPAFLAGRVPARNTKVYPLPVLTTDHQKVKSRVLVLQGCVQKAATPQVNQALASLLDSQGVSVEFLTEETCCGALDYHLAAHGVARQRMRRLIDQLSQRLAEVDFIVSTASGCGVTLKEYPKILRQDDDYYAKAQALCAKLVDVSELLGQYSFDCEPAKIAFQSPCSLQHGQQLAGRVEAILQRAGFELTTVQDAHLCCGSAGTYSVLQPQIAGALRSQKLANLQSGEPLLIATANIGCQLHLRPAAQVDVVHWVELLADRLRP